MSKCTSVDGPRDHLMRCGPEAMSDPELLAVVLGSGMKGRPVRRLAEQLLSQLGSVEALTLASARELCSVSGIGAARASRLVASFQLAKRAQESHRKGQPLRGPRDVYERLKGRLASLEQEVFVVLALDVRGQVIEDIEIARGSVSGVEVHPREVFKPLLRRAAFACVVAHNHPSGDPEPSAEDLQLTDRLSQVGSLVGIELVDHIVIAKGGFSSMADRLAAA